MMPSGANSMLWLAFVGVFLILWALLYPAVHALRFGGRHASRVLARWSKVDRYAAYLPVVLIVLLGGLVTVWAADEFIDLAESIQHKNGRLARVDGTVHDSVVRHRTASATTFFNTMSTIGGPAGVGTIAAIVAIALFIARRFRWAAYLFVTIGGGAALDAELKHYFARARPDVAEMLRHASGYSFPSGHAMGSTITFGALTYLAFRLTSKWRWQSAALAFAITLVLSVALSRVYLGVHWISDVGGGVVAGLFWLGSTTAAYEMLRRVRRLRALRDR